MGIKRIMNKHKSIKKPNTTTKYKQASKSVNAKPKKRESTQKYLIKRILITNGLTLLVIIGTYFWMIFFLSNVNSFWDIFRNKEVSTNIDSIAPVHPYLTPLPEATNENTIDISGRAEPGVKVLLFLDNEKNTESIADSDGVFSFASVPVGGYKQEIYVLAEDDAGNTSNPSLKYTITKDSVPPEIEIITPTKGEKHKSTGHSYRVSGTTESGASVLINEQLAVMTPTGEFSASIRLERGSNEITIVATDKAGNETEEKIYMEFEKID